MSEQAKKSLLHFMKKQISEKSSKINAEHKLAASNNKSHDEKHDDSKDEDEMTEEEKELVDAKKKSKSKAAEINQAEMIKKLSLEVFVKYTTLVAVCFIFAIGLIQFGPAVAKFFHGIIFKALMATLNN